MFELLTGVGVVLPGGAGVLRFGSDPVAAAAVLGALGAGRSALRARWGEVVLTAHTDGELRLCSVVLTRDEGSGDAPGGTPVVLDGIDLFGYPAAEVRAALGPRPGLELRPADGPGHPTGVTLHAAPPVGRRARAAAEEAEVARALAELEPLWTTGRDHWELLESGGGHLPRRKDGTGSTLLICHETVARRVVAAMLAAGVEVVPEPS
ncbi:hypothetical protein ACIQBJ_02185 [Kitasatospora sp. NPDC088391]|uniref:hypothetical protein n=1 Tax=Kitasatospora sp. NPDC088391 TaxID=3364074 RepID=UPI0038179110